MCTASTYVWVNLKVKFLNYWFKKKKCYRIFASLYSAELYIIIICAPSPDCSLHLYLYNIIYMYIWEWGCVRRFPSRSALRPPTTFLAVVVHYYNIYIIILCMLSRGRYRKTIWWTRLWQDVLFRMRWETFPNGRPETIIKWNTIHRVIY